MKRLIFSLLLTFVMCGCGPKPINPDIVFRYKLGDKKLVLMSDGENRVSETLLYNYTPAMIEGLNYNGKPLNSFNSFLLETDDQKYMFDTGTGARLKYNFPKADADPEEISKIYITHLHGDHIGGMLKNGEKVFPNATIYISQPEYEYWTDEQIINSFPSHKRSSFDFAAKFLEAYKDQIKLFSPASLEEGGTEIEPGITAFLAPGHTPGHTIYLIDGGKKKIMIWGDITHITELQLRYPSVTISYDVDPEQAWKTREKVIEYVYNNDLQIAGMHIVYPAIGNISKNKNGYYEFNPVKAPKRNNFEMS